MKKKYLNKITIAVAIIAMVAAYKIFNLGDYLTLSYIKESQAGFQSLYHENRAAVIASYMAIYILVTGLSLPGAVIMTLAGGALFGLVTGTIVVSFASTIGATLACFVARFILRDWVQEKYGDKLKIVNDGVEKEGSLYLFTARLVVYIPFFLINLAIGLTKMPLRTFYWVSQIGMLPGTIVYVNAGVEVAKIESPADILSLRLIVAFGLLGVFPIVTKKLVQLYRKRKGMAST